MNYRLIEDIDNVAVYGWVVDINKYNTLPYHDKCLFEPVTNEEEYDTCVLHYLNGKQIDGRKFLFFSNEKNEIKYASLILPSTLHGKTFKTYNIKKDTFASMSFENISGFFVVIIRK